ncbi:MAG: HipA domain-containing protein, partial [Aquincola tertiaricarbonis]
SAGGEQAKFLTHEEAGHPLIVKFTPPLATPFGDRWRDLLQAEALALQVLADWGVPVAASEVVETGRRAFLVSRRFDRLPGGGRLHVVPLDAVHDAFVAGGRQHWGATCHALERQRRLPAGAGMQAEALLHFGRLIGNTDMHFGNLSLVVQPQGVPGGRFAGLAPVYDMLPMRWRPDAAIGLVDIEPFSPDELAMGSPARAPALQFWQRLADLPAASRPLRRPAQAMAQRQR